MQEITSMPALELARRIKDKEISVTEVVKTQLDIIYKKEPAYNSYITVTEKEALSQAKEVQKRIDEGELNHSPLAGVTVAIKDNICTKGIRTTCASKILADYIPAYDATVIEKLKDAGLILIGKTNMDEFAMGDSTRTSYFGETKNPWNIKHTPGGSSGGSAAAVAAEEAHVSLGSDTGGSIRQPASYCGLVGLKPTYGTVSRYGLVAFASSLDQIGPIGRNVPDCAALYEVISGYDPKDSTSVNSAFSHSQALLDDVRGMKIGVPRPFLEADMDEDIRRRFHEALKTFENMGAFVELFDFEEVKYCVQVYQVISCAEAFSNLSRYDGVKYGLRAGGYDNLEELYKKTRSEGFGYEVKRRIMLGAFVLSRGNYDAYYIKAGKIRRLISEAYRKAFERYDIIMSPVTLRTAPPLSEKKSSSPGKFSSLTLNSSVNLAGLPAASIPCGRDKKGMPFGLQLVGKWFGEKDIIRAAYAFERTMPYERPEGELM